MSDGATVRILGIAGSLRRGSFNAATLRAAQELAPHIRINGVALGPTLPGKNDKKETFAKLHKLAPLGHTITTNSLGETTCEHSRCSKQRYP